MTASRGSRARARLRPSAVGKRFADTSTPSRWDHVGAAARDRFSDAFDDGAGAEATAAAHRHQAVSPTATFELVEGLGEQERTGATEGMAEGDGPTVGVDAIHGDLELLGPRQDDRGERLVDLVDRDVVDPEAGALEEATGGIDRAGEHEIGR